MTRRFEGVLGDILASKLPSHVTLSARSLIGIWEDSRQVFYCRALRERADVAASVPNKTGRLHAQMQLRLVGIDSTVAPLLNSSEPANGHFLQGGITEYRGRIEATTSRCMYRRPVPLRAHQRQSNGDAEDEECVSRRRTQQDGKQD